MIQYRPHRGGLAEAMKEAVYLSSAADLRRLLAEKHEVHVDRVSGITTRIYDSGPDQRIGWPETWSVEAMVDTALGRIRSIGFTSAKLPDSVDAR